MSGFRLLDRSEDALRWRLALVDSPRHTLDLQYYICSGDDSGVLLAKRDVDAANRGVKVRIIIDDLDTMLRDASTPGIRDQGIAMIHAHPNIRVPLFNAWKSRSLAGRGTELVGSMERLNRRMHNKQMIAHDCIAIVGGRNVADEYLGLNGDFNFKDLDGLGVGPVARQAPGALRMSWTIDSIDSWGVLLYGNSGGSQEYAHCQRYRRPSPVLLLKLRLQRTAARARAEGTNSLQILDRACCAGSESRLLCPGA